MTGRVGPGRRAWLAGSGGTAGRVWWHGGPGWGTWSAGSGGHGGPGGAGRAGRSGPGGAVGAGRVCQDLAWPGRSSCERTHEWFLEMCVPSELARGIKLATNLDT